MNKLKLVLKQYRSIESHILYAIGVQFSVQVVSTSFFLLLNYYMAGEGYPDFRIATWHMAQHDTRIVTGVH